MAKLTIAQMREELDRERTARQNQEKEIAQLRYEVEDLRMQLARAKEAELAEIQERKYLAEEYQRIIDSLQAERKAPAAKAPRAAYEMPAWQTERKEKMERAREAAMQLRTMIKV